MRSSLAYLAAFVVIATACNGTSESTAGVTSTTEAPASTATATTSTTTSTIAPDEPAAQPEYLFTLTATEVLGIGAEDWENGFVGPGSVDYLDGEYHLFYVGFPNRNTTATFGIGYAKSRNGLDFFRQQDEPVIDVGALELDYFDPATGTVNPGNVLIGEDGTWIMYFSTTGLGGRPGSGLIGRATAPGPSGPWTFDPEPVLLPGEAGAWDSNSAINPHVVRTADSYLMWYDGHLTDLDANPSRHIGLATSTDGIEWTKHDDEATTDAPFASSDPVFMLNDGEDAWDGLRVTEPSVIETDGDFVLFYSSDRRYENQLERTWEWGYATSADGVSWDRSSENPVWSSIGDVFTLMFSSTVVQTPEGAWRIYVGTQSGISLPTTVRLLELNVPLP